MAEDISVMARRLIRGVDFSAEGEKWAREIRAQRILNLKTGLTSTGAPFRRNAPSTLRKKGRGKRPGIDSGKTLAKMRGSKIIALRSGNVAIVLANARRTIVHYIASQGRDFISLQKEEIRNLTKRYLREAMKQKGFK
jgi:hypothetical protein